MSTHKLGIRHIFVVRGLELWTPLKNSKVKSKFVDYIAFDDLNKDYLKYNSQANLINLDSSAYLHISRASPCTASSGTKITWNSTDLCLQVK